MASGLLLVAAEQVTELHAGHDALVVMIVGMAALVAYAIHGRQTPHPMVDLGLLRIKSFRIALIGSLVARLGVAGMPFLLVLYLQEARDWPPLQAGLMLVPQALAMIAMKPLIKRLLDRHGYRRTLFVNTTVVGLLLCGFALFGKATPWPVMAALVFAYGLAMSVQFTAMNTLAFVDLPDSAAGMASSMTSSVQYLSMSFGIALASTLMAMQLDAGGRMIDAVAYIDAFRGSALVLGTVTLAAAGVFAQLRNDRPRRQPVESPETVV